MQTNVTIQLLAGKSLIFMAVVVSALSFTQPAFAQNATAADDSITPKQTSLFCAKVDSSVIALDQLLSESETKYSEATITRKQTLAETRTESDKSLADARIKADESYSEQYKILMAAAVTKTEKKAVTSFQKTVTQAITDRREAVDAAIKTYRAGVDKVMSTRESKYSAAITTLKATIDSAYASAKADCAADGTATASGSAVNPQVKNDLAMQNARTQFANTIAALEKDTAKIETLTSARDTAVGDADALFQTIVQAAGGKLKIALNQ
jgi:hypothetical protein